MVYPLKHGRSLYIDGIWEELPESCVEAVINPATEEIIGEAPLGQMENLDAALAAARRAFDEGPWPRTPRVERVRLLSLFLDAIEANRDKIVPLIVAEIGVPPSAAASDIGRTVAYSRKMLEYALNETTIAYPPEVTASSDGTKILGTALAVRMPIGVVAAITPFNVPFLNIVKIVPAMAMGNSVVLKPSPYTPFQALILGDIADQVGIPAGVLNIITGGLDVGKGLSCDPRVDIISFTGSDKVGSDLQAQAAPTLKRLLLELGGKSALIVRADADLARATATALPSFSSRAGQGCLLTTRHLVHNSIRADYVARLRGLAEGLKIGNPLDPGVQMGPLIRDVQRSRTEHYVEVALAEGAKLVTGGARPEHLSKGFFYRPTIFDDVQNRWRIAQEEVFGPVAVVIGFDTDEEAIAIANDSQFGLHGGIFSADTGRAYEMAMQLQTGNVAINGGSGGWNAAAPFGGIRRSGYGREFGLEGLHEYSYLKSITFRAG